jgi:hypothetical protein
MTRAGRSHVPRYPIPFEYRKLGPVASAKRAGAAFPHLMGAPFSAEQVRLNAANTVN